MTGKASYTLIGAFVLILSGVFVWGILWISAGGPPQRLDTYLIYMTESVSGLNVDSPIKYRGVDVGQVRALGIDAKNPERVRVLIQVRQDVPITVDTVATLEYQGITGLANINLSGTSADSPPLKDVAGEDYPIIPTEPSLFARLDATMSDLMANLMQTSASINATLDAGNRDRIATTLENVAVLSENLARQSGQFDAMMARLRETLDNTSAATAEFPRLARDFSDSAAAITAMADELRTVGETVGAAGEELRRTIATTGDGLSRFTGDTLPEVAGLVEQLRLASENLRQMSESLANDPSVLLYGSAEPPPGPGE
ncbi:MAG: MlaD family protein [Woeseiaceae bacterium]|nr:MlaD family protein [Woeseiaceae bacterium]